MRWRIEILAYALVTGTVACGGNRPLASSAGSVGASGAGASGSAGRAGVAGQAGAGGAPAAVCGAPTRACGDQCVDPSWDDDNCGACGRACAPTATCSDGVCGPPVVTVVPAFVGCESIDLAVSGDRIFWADKGHGQVRSMALAGGAVTTLASGESAPKRVAVNGETIFWLDEGTKTIRESVSGGAATTIVTSMLDIGGFVVTPDGGTVYFSSGTTISSVPAAGGAPVVVGREERLGQPKALALDGNTIAFPNDVAGNVDVITLVDGQVASCGGLDSDDGDLLMINCARVARGHPGLFLETILAPPGHALFVDASEIYDATPGPSPIVLVSGAVNDISGLAMAANTIWFSDASVIYRAVNHSLSTSFRIARQQNAPRSVAIGAVKIYWSTGDCTIESTDP